MATDRIKSLYSPLGIYIHMGPFFETEYQVHCAKGDFSCKEPSILS